MLTKIVKQGNRLKQKLSIKSNNLQQQNFHVFNAPNQISNNFNSVQSNITVEQTLFKQILSRQNNKYAKKNRKLTNNLQFNFNTYQKISQSQFLKNLNGTHNPSYNYAQETNGRQWKLLHQLFTEQAKKTPNNIAIQDKNTSFTYQQLDEITDKLAGNLQKNIGVQIGDSVAIYMERNLDYIISYIAILKAGGGYLPIEKNNPIPNVLKMLKTGNCKTILTNINFKQHIKEIKQQQPYHKVICMDRWDRESDQYQYEPELLKSQTLDDLAFVVLSSGSTGEPKGIAAPHISSVHGYLERHEFNQYKHGDKVGCNIFFVWEILRPLLQGATVVPIPENVIFDPSLLLDFIEDHSLTEVLFTPSLLETVLLSTKKDKFLQKTKTMKTFYLNGEPVKVSLKNKLIETLPEHVNILNTYSISECHDISNENVRKSRDCESGFITCGIPVDKVDVLLLDLQTQEKITTPNTQGEVLIGGPGVAIGYLNGPPELNENGFPIIDGKKYHRTGDIGLIHEDKRFEIIGRCNSKVKMRGYTIFLGSVEKSLTEHLNLDTCLVVLDEAEQKMTAYLVKNENSVKFNITERGTSQDIRQIMRDSLPDYAIPQYYVEISEIPINHLSGKAKKNLLPTPPYKNKNFEDENAEKAEILKVEENASDQHKFDVLKQIWAQVLDTQPENIRENCNFFDIGGHSLLAVQIIVQCEEIFGIKLQVQELYEHPQLNQYLNIINQQIIKQKNNNNMEQEQKINTPEFIETLQKDAQIGVEGLQFKYNNQKQQIASECEQVLITGTTGFLGCFILNEVLTNPNNINLKNVHCLVRAQSTEKGMERIVKNLKYYQLYDNLTPEQISKIVPVAGDISQQNLGIDNQIYEQLKQKVEFVYHCAAAVNFIQPYSILKPATVDGTSNMIKFCSSTENNEAKPIYFVSTNGILPPQYPTKFQEDQKIDAYLPHLVNDGYGQSKWVAEKMIWLAQNQGGLKAAAFRLGNVGHVKSTGAKNPIDFQSQLIESCEIIGSAPDNNDWKLEASPVDFIANSMVNLSQKNENFGKVYHIIETNPVQSLKVFENLKNKGYIPKIEPFADWQVNIEKGCQQYKGVDQHKYDTLLSIKESLSDLQKYLTDSNKYSREQTTNDLKKLGINYDSVDDIYYEKILSCQQQ